MKRLMASLFMLFSVSDGFAASGAGIRVNEALFEQAFKKIVKSGAVKLEFGSKDVDSEYNLKCLTPKVRITDSIRLRLACSVVSPKYDFNLPCVYSDVSEIPESEFTPGQPNKCALIEVSILPAISSTQKLTFDRMKLERFNPIPVGFNASLSRKFAPIEKEIMDRMNDALKKFGNPWIGDAIPAPISFSGLQIDVGGASAKVAAQPTKIEIDTATQSLLIGAAVAVGYQGQDPFSQLPSPVYPPNISQSSPGMAACMGSSLLTSEIPEFFNRTQLAGLAEKMIEAIGSLGGSDPNASVAPMQAKIVQLSSGQSVLEIFIPEVKYSVRFADIGPIGGARVGVKSPVTVRGTFAVTPDGRSIVLTGMDAAFDFKADIGGTFGSALSFVLNEVAKSFDVNGKAREELLKRLALSERVSTLFSNEIKVMEKSVKVDVRVTSVLTTASSICMTSELR